MKKWKWNREKRIGTGINRLIVFVLAVILIGCGKVQDGDGVSEDRKAAAETGEEDAASEDAEAHNGDSTSENAEVRGGKEVPADEVGIAGESGEDSRIDFAALWEENPEIFAWLYVPGTEIDAPVLQSMQGDDYYETHNASREEDADGAVYIELANVANMCDFNTVLHGRSGAEATGPFSELYRFADPDFFEEHEQIYLYLDGNVLTYEIFAAYERENTSLIREYDFTYYAGCKQFLDDLYGTRDLSMNLRKGWEGLTPYQFLVTLTTQKDAEDDRQMVVVAVLTADAAGTIDRIVAE